MRVDAFRQIADGLRLQEPASGGAVVAPWNWTQGRCFVPVPNLVLHADRLGRSAHYVLLIKWDETTEDTRA
jgi:hypothetical protein